MTIKLNKQIKICIPFQVWESANMNVAKNDVRWYLTGVHLKSGRVEATNGHVAYMAKIGDEDFPSFVTDTTPTKDSFIVKTKNKIPKKTRTNKLAFVFVLVSGNKASIEYVDWFGDVTSTDVAEIIKGKYPNIPKLISTARKEPKIAACETGIRAEYLAIPYKMTKSSMSTVISVEIFNPNSAILFDIKRVELIGVKETLVIMPCRL